MLRRKTPWKMFSSQSSKASIQFCATIRTLRWLQAILLMQRCVLDPNSAQKRARELRHLCAMMNETLLIESHWVNLFFTTNGSYFDNHNHFNTLSMQLGNMRFRRNILAILVLAFYIQIKLKIIYHYRITQVDTIKRPLT